MRIHSNAQNTSASGDAAKSPAVNKKVPIYAGTSWMFIMCGINYSNF